MHQPAPSPVLQNKLLNPVVCVIFYGLSIVGLGIVLYPFILWKKPLSAHHGGYMCLLSFLVLTSGGVIMYERSFDVEEASSLQTEADVISDSNEEGGKKEMTIEEFNTYMETLRLENEKDPDFQARKNAEAQGEETEEPEGVQSVE